MMKRVAKRIGMPDFRVRVLLFGVLSLLIILIILGSLLAAGIQTHELAVDLARPILRSMQQEIDSELHRLFDPINNRLLRAYWWARHDPDAWQDPNLARSFLTTEMLQLPQCVAVRVSDTTGYELTIFRSGIEGQPEIAGAKGTWWTRELRSGRVPTRATWTLWDASATKQLGQVQREERLTVEELSRLRASNQPDARSDEAESFYDPRRRAWYGGALAKYRRLQAEEIAAGRTDTIFWSDIEPFYLTQTRGLTASIAVIDPQGRTAVIAYELLLDDFATSIASLRPTPQSLVSIYSDIGENLGTVGSKGARNLRLSIAPAREPGLAELRKLLDRAGGAKPDLIYVERDGRASWAGLQSYPLSQEKRIWAGIVIPELDLTRGLLAAHRREALWAAMLAALAAILLAWFLARRLARPLDTLVQWSRRIAALDLEPGPRSPSKIAEVEALSDSMEDMRAALQRHLSARAQAEQELQESHHQLEARVEERTLELRQANGELEREILVRRKIEGELRDSEERFRALVETTSDWIWETDRGGQLTYTSPRVNELLGHAPQEALDMPITRLLASTSDTAGTEAFDKAWGSFEPLVRYESLATHRNGSPLVLETSASPYFDDAGRFSGYRGISRNVTDRKELEHEQRALEAKMQHAQKLESLGVLAGGIAHDFNNLLMGVLGNVELALQELPPESGIQPRLQGVRTAAVRLAELTSQMLAYAGKGKFMVKALDLSRIVSEMAHLLSISISKRVVVNYDLAQQLPLVMADATQLRQVVLNLITNASEAIGERSGSIMLRTGVLEVDRAYLTDALHDGELGNGCYVYLEVADTGCGMSDEIRTRVFDPFFTTKFTGRGLGLAAVQGIVRSHHGAIKLASEAGKGSTFRILLPCAHEARAAQERPVNATLQLPAGLRVLVVDDEETVRAMARLMLERAGVEVMTAVDGRQALEIIRKRGRQLDIVLLDLTMPHLNGIETFAEIRRLSTDLKIILCSGYTEQDTMPHFQGKDLAAFLHKPYDIVELLAALRKALEMDGQYGRQGHF